MLPLRGCWDTERARRSASEAGPDYRERKFKAIYERPMSDSVYIAIFDLIVYRKSRLNLLRKL